MPCDATRRDVQTVARDLDDYKRLMIRIARAKRARGSALHSATRLSGLDCVVVAAVRPTCYRGYPVACATVSAWDAAQRPLRRSLRCAALRWPLQSNGAPSWSTSGGRCTTSGTTYATLRRVAGAPAAASTTTATHARARCGAVRCTRRCCAAVQNVLVMAWDLQVMRAHPPSCAGSGMYTEACPSYHISSAITKSVVRTRHAHCGCIACSAPWPMRWHPPRLCYARAVAALQ